MLKVVTICASRRKPISGKRVSWMLTASKSITNKETKTKTLSNKISLLIVARPQH